MKSVRAVLRRDFAVRGRLYVAMMVALAVAALVPDALSVPTRLIAGWDAGALFYLGQAWTMISRAGPTAIRHRARMEDEGRWAMLAISAGAACTSLLAIGFVLSEAGPAQTTSSALHLVLAAATIVLSWLFMHTLFGLHYAHTYYSDAPGTGGGKAREGLAFPGETEPDYWDFMYFAFVIGMTAQVSDVAISDRGIRRLALLHGILAFFFNTVILALTVSIAAGLI